MRNKFFNLFACDKGKVSLVFVIESPKLFFPFFPRTNRIYPWTITGFAKIATKQWSRYAIVIVFSCCEKWNTDIWQVTFENRRELRGGEADIWRDSLICWRYFCLWFQDLFIKFRWASKQTIFCFRTDV